MTERPVCGLGCPHYVRGTDTSGTCRAEPPTLTSFLKVVKVTDGVGDDDPARKVTGNHGKFPSLPPDEPCCALHPSFPAYAGRFAIEARRVGARPLDIDDDADTS